jgi:nitrogen regulatory protein PII
MKKIIAIIPDECVEQTKTALEKLGIVAVAVQHVYELNRQKYTKCTPDPHVFMHHVNCIHQLQTQKMPAVKESPVYHDCGEQEFQRRFHLKGMLIVFVSKEKVHPVIHALITVNQSGLSGEGKIFICPMVTALEIRDYELDNTTPL